MTANLCNLVIPALGVLLVYAGRRRSRAVLIRISVALAWAYLLHFVDHVWRIWGHFDLDYSTHTAVAIAIGTTLAALGLPWLMATVALWVSYALLMMNLGYHTLGDIVSTAGINLPVAAAAQLLPRRQTAEA